MGEAGNQEPTMEEILASIRRIISEDDAGDDGKEKAKAAPRARAPEPEPEPPPPQRERPRARRPEPEPEPEPVAMAEDDGFDDFEAGPAAAFASNSAQAAFAESEDFGGRGDDEDVLELTDVVEEPPVEVDLADDPPPRRRAAGEDGLVSPPTAEDALAAFGSLAAAVSGRRDLPIGNGARTLEEMVKELLRPMLKDWLDANLAAIVQRAVEREVARIANRTDDFRRR